MLALQESLNGVGGLDKNAPVKLYEEEEGFTLEFLEPQLAIDVNRETIPDDFTRVMLE